MDKETGDERRSPFGAPLFIVATLFLVLLIGLGIWLGVRNPNTPPDPSTPLGGSEQNYQNEEGQGIEPVQEEPDDSLVVPAVGDSICGLPPGNQDVPRQALPSTPVAVGERLTVPHIGGMGPGVTTGISQCFAHSPTGAVLAAANFMTWTSSKQQLPLVLQDLVFDDVHGQNKIKEGIDQWDGSTGSAATIHGFVFDFQGPNDALVILAVTMPPNTQTYVGFPLALTWADGDWKVVIPPTYDWGEYPITDLDHEGFTRWEG